MNTTSGIAGCSEAALRRELIKPGTGTPATIRISKMMLGIAAGRQLFVEQPATPATITLRIGRNVSSQEASSEAHIARIRGAAARRFYYSPMSDEMTAIFIRSHSILKH